MKRILLTLLCVSSLLAVGCSEESTTDFNSNENASDNLNQLAARSSVWDGEIGIENDGVFKITADIAALKADLNNTLKAQGYNTTVQDLQIVVKDAANKPGDSTPLLLGTNNIGTSIGVFLTKRSNILIVNPSFQGSVTCSGCAQGCNLSYFDIDGKKVPYCNENGCNYDCTKSESSM